MLQDISRLSRLRIQSLPLGPELTRLGPCLADIGNIYCIGLNYKQHAAESGMEVPSEPVVFMKSTSAISGPNDPIVLPHNSESTDWEAELGVIIGRTARNVSPEDALDYVAGYCIVNDISERQRQFATSQWVKGKSCPTFAPVGPWLVTPDEIPDPQKLHIWLKVNGETMQDGNTSDMIFSVAELISHLSQFMILQAGDLIVTGTPAGVGSARDPQQFLRAGDIVQTGIDGLGIQRQKVVYEYEPEPEPEPEPEQEPETIQ